MVNKNKFIKSFSLVLMLVFMASLVSGNWVTYSRDNENTNYQFDGDGYYSNNGTHIVLEKTTDINYLTEIRPVSDDFDGDGIEEIFVYDGSSGNINVLNMDSNNNLVLMDSYLFPQIKEAVITADDNGNSIYVAKSNNQITALSYSGGALSEYKTVSDVNTMTSQMLCALQGVDSDPYCYYFNSTNYLNVWDIKNNVILSSNVSYSHANEFILTDLELDLVKDIYTYSGRNLIKINGIFINNSTTVQVSPTSNDYIDGIVSGSATTFAIVYGQPSTGRYDYLAIYDSNLNRLANRQICQYLSTPAVHDISLSVIKYNNGRHYLASCDSPQFPKNTHVIDTSGNIVITNQFYRDVEFIGTGNLLLDNNNYSEYIIGSSFNYYNSSTGLRQAYTSPYTLTDKYIISDFNNNGYNDIIETTLGGLNIYNSVNIAPPSGSSIIFVSGRDYSGFYGFYGSSSVCTNSVLTFKSNRCLSTSTSTECSYYYDGTSRQRLVANVGGTYYFGDYTYSVGDFTLSVPVDAFAKEGSYSVVLYVQLEESPNDFSFNSGQFQVNVNGKTEGINCNVPDTFLVNPTDKSDSISKGAGLDEFFDSLLGNNPKTKAIFGIGLVLGIVIYVGYMIKSWIVILLTFILAMVLVTIFGLLQPWVIVLIILAVILIMVFKGTLSKGNSGEE